MVPNQPRALMAKPCSKAASVMLGLARKRRPDALLAWLRLPIMRQDLAYPGGPADGHVTVQWPMP